MSLILQIFVSNELHKKVLQYPRVFYVHVPNIYQNGYSVKIILFYVTGALKSIFNKQIFQNEGLVVPPGDITLLHNQHTVALKSSNQRPPRLKQNSVHTRM